MPRVIANNGITDFNAIRLTVASPEDILKWSNGEVTKPETINYRTQKPERDGLFCERIFGPVKDVNPHDNKLKGVRSREAAVDKNGELITKSIVRRERMAHIALATPVAHIWFMRGTPSAMSLLLGITVRNLERIAYFSTYVILKSDDKKREQYLADLEAETEAGKVAIKIRFEREAGVENADVKALATAQSAELAELDESYLAKKSQLEMLVKGALISEVDFRNLPEEYEELVEVGMGGAALKTLLDEIDLAALIAKLTTEVLEAKGQREKKLLKRLKMLEGMAVAGIKPNSLALTILPVIPPDLRPMVQLTGGRFATSDLNDLYRRVINRNNRLKKLIGLNAPEVIRRNEMRMLQEAVDALIDNSAAKGNRAVNATGGRRRLKSISDMLKGKQGRFRQNLLGKRVDYSGRSVIVVGPKLHIHECGLPKQMALELFKPFIISWLIRNEHAYNIRSASRLIESGDALVWDALDAVIEGKYVLLNRAPSLHRLSIQAFQPKLVEGKAIQLHPLVANGFNADYDGDQMAVHLPLSDNAQREARELMSATNNLLKPADGVPVLNIGQDVVLGNYYLTYEKPSAQTKEVKAYSSVYEAEMAYDDKKLQLQSPIRVYTKGEIRNTTLGRVFFNEILPVDFPYDNSIQAKKQLKKVLAKIFNDYGPETTAYTADRMKGLAFRFATIAAVSTGQEDYIQFSEISEFVVEGDAKTALIAEQFDQGLITEEERYSLTIAAWRAVDRKIADFLRIKMRDMDTSISVMVNSGARGDISNVKWASAMIGIVVDSNNREIELPIRSNYKDGLSSLEQFVATRGARKGLIDTALKTADAGYLTRRLVDVSQDVFTVEDSEVSDDDGFAILRSESELTMINFGNRLVGRYTAEAIPGIVENDTIITRDIANAIESDETIASVKIQSVLTTKNLRGIPRKSYGIDMSTGRIVDAAQPVGVIAAQSVGEPGTQLTLKTFHKGGEAGGDITQGLPRVEELFEARSPKGQAYITEVTGLVDMWEDGKKYIVQVTPEAGHVERIALDGRTVVVKSGSNIKVGDVLATGESETRPLTAPFDGVLEIAEDTLILAANASSPVRYEIPGTAQVVVAAGDVVEAGDRLTSGSLNLHDLMRLKGTEATQRYIINEVLRIYAAQGQDVADKHLEIIVRQMFSRVQVEDPGDGIFVTGDIVSKALVVEANAELAAAGKSLIGYTQLLLGITKVSIWSDSFLSAASFQDTTRVLINAAISGRIDRLHGLKENVIIGRKIPVGTGALDYVNPSEPDSDVVEEIAANIELAI
ncbi:DNA-directed RNA polymerase subunit beta' [Candidatus Saccharibacteria bacterium CG11_big_fil_rev_8_21_14_0_20_41_19]|nr:DNA-directed RNA polymerase subunit beta' [Candidatus Saccharibacteria bacterium]OIP86229.1 MAG: DNA-directed RNA polymerase subunit beta' [Candidatus Saccharibacteria bacterium CG2_30_41_52]PIQ71042.1 MAG: DNA-directed RNA polymerase subunit beta' [Candidatus Saccharibacteria bacterium CG11_big_fil_rev_8_21_14_0_20_41_19]PIZ59423.1 MAG: DNA-directed RNA polymerase subunit beta' [Candidatus Saccharibacteria bacterium CG_4_10_14_0_2_um_filter_41_11]PJC29334.1 MAG: DNA-directed RNA polymerase 